jgi:hypothetical protein
VIAKGALAILERNSGSGTTLNQNLHFSLPQFAKKVIVICIN